MIPICRDSVVNTFFTATNVSCEKVVLTSERVKPVGGEGAGGGWLCGEERVPDYNSWKLTQSCDVSSKL